MVTLEQVKNYLKVDEDVTQDDELIQNMMNTAAQIAIDRSGVTEGYVFDMFVQVVTAHWYENRKLYSEKPGAINEIPFSAGYLLKHLADMGECHGY